MFCVFTDKRAREERAPVQDLVIRRAELNHLARLNLGRFVCSQARRGEKKEHPYKTCARWEARPNVQCFMCSQAGGREKKEHLYTRPVQDGLREARLDLWCFVGSQAVWGERKEHLYQILTMGWERQDLTCDVLCVHRPEGKRGRSTYTRPVQDGKQD